MVVDSPPDLVRDARHGQGTPPFMHRRALALWPRLDRRALARCGSDSACIARHVARRTSLSTEVIQALIEQGDLPNEDDVRLWFG